MKLSTSRDALFAQLQTVTRAASTRSAVQALSGVQLDAPRAARRAARHRHGDRPPRPARGRGRRARAPSCCRRGCSLDVVRALPGDDRLARAARRRAGRRDRRGHRDVPHPHAARSRTSRRFPEPEGDGDVERARRRRSSRRSLKVARSASRDETRPVLTGILVSAVGERAADGRHRLLPAVASRRRSSRRRWTASFEANVPARALQELDADRPARPSAEQLERRRARRTRSSSRSAASCCRRG